MSYKKSGFLNRNEELVFQQALDHIDKTIKYLLPSLSYPRIKTTGEGVNAFQFSEKDSRHAIVLKLVGFTSNLRAGMLLINHGFFYQWSALKRSLYEAAEDIGFLLVGDQEDNHDQLHDRFLGVFYEGDLDDKGDLKKESIHPVQRSEIRRFLIDHYEDVDRLAEGMPAPEEFTRALYRLGSGYIHGRAAHIMSLYDQEMNLFHTDGWRNEEYLALEQEYFLELVFWAIMCSINLGMRWEVGGGFPFTSLNSFLCVLGKLEAERTSAESVSGSRPSIDTP